MLIFISLSAFSILLWIHLRSTYLKPKFYSASFLIPPQKNKILAYQSALKGLNWPLFLLRLILLSLVILGISHFTPFAQISQKSKVQPQQRICFRSIDHHRDLEGLAISLVLSQNIEITQTQIKIEIEDQHLSQQWQFDQKLTLKPHDQDLDQVAYHLSIPQKQLPFSLFQSLKAKIYIEYQGKTISQIPLCLPAVLPEIDPSLDIFAQIQQALISAYGIDQHIEKGGAEIKWVLNSSSPPQLSALLTNQWFPFSEVNYHFEQGLESNSRLLHLDYDAISDFWVSRWQKQVDGTAFLWAKSEQTADQKLDPVGSIGYQDGLWRKFGFLSQDLQDRMFVLGLYLSFLDQDQQQFCRCKNLSLGEDLDINLLGLGAKGILVFKDQKEQQRIESTSFKGNRIINHIGLYQIQPIDQNDQNAYLAVLPSTNQELILSLDMSQNQLEMPDLDTPNFDDLYRWHSSLLIIIFILAILLAFKQKRWLFAILILILILAFHQSFIQITPILFHSSATDDMSIRQQQAWQKKMVELEMNVNLIDQVDSQSIASALESLSNTQTQRILLSDQISDDLHTEQYLIDRVPKQEIFDLRSLHQSYDINGDCFFVLRLNHRFKEKQWQDELSKEKWTISYPHHQYEFPFTELDQPHRFPCDDLKVGEKIDITIKSQLSTTWLKKYQEAHHWTEGTFNEQTLHIPLKIKDQNQSLALAYGGNAQEYANTAGFSLNHIEDIWGIQPISSSLKAIFLDQIQGHLFSLEQVQRLEQWVEEGGVLWVSGDQSTFSQGNMLGSALERILPITAQARAEDKDLKLSVLIDHSGSMSVEAGGIGLLRIQDKIKELISYLRPKDQIEIIAFAGQSQKILESTELSKIDQIPLPHITQGSSFLIPALGQMSDQTFETDIHIALIFSDGILGDKIDLTQAFDLIQKKYKKTIFLTIQTNQNQKSITDQYPLGRLLFDLPNQQANPLQHQVQNLLFDRFEPQVLIKWLNQSPKKNQGLVPSKAWLVAEIGAVPQFGQSDATSLKPKSIPWLTQDQYPILSSHQMGLGQVWVMSASDIVLKAEQWQKLLKQAYQQQRSIEIKQNHHILWLYGENIPKTIEATAYFKGAPPQNMRLNTHAIHDDLSMIDLHQIQEFKQLSQASFLLELPSIQSEIWIDLSDLKVTHHQDLDLTLVPYAPQEELLKNLRTKLCRWQISDGIWILLILLLIYESTTLRIQSFYTKVKHL